MRCDKIPSFGYRSTPGFEEAHHGILPLFVVQQISVDSQTCLCFSTQCKQLKKRNHEIDHSPLGNNKEMILHLFVSSWKFLLSKFLPI
jgi:hypothetical protein